MIFVATTVVETRALSPLVPSSRTQISMFFQSPLRPAHSFSPALLSTSSTLYSPRLAFLALPHSAHSKPQSVSYLLPTAPFQDLSPIQMMFVMTAFSTIFSFVTLVHQDELVPFFTFVSSHPEIHLHFVAFGVCSTIGQLLIFHTIRSFGAVVFAIIMTVSFGRWGACLPSQRRRGCVLRGDST